MSGLPPIPAAPERKQPRLLLGRSVPNRKSGGVRKGGRDDRGVPYHAESSIDPSSAQVLKQWLAVLELLEWLGERQCPSPWGHFSWKGNFRCTSCVVVVGGGWCVVVVGVVCVCVVVNSSSRSREADRVRDG